MGVKGILTYQHQIPHLLKREKGRNNGLLSVSYKVLSEDF
jgi:hypothetical protein